VENLPWNLANWPVEFEKFVMEKCGLSSLSLYI